MTQYSSNNNKNDKNTAQQQKFKWNEELIR